MDVNKCNVTDESDCNQFVSAPPLPLVLIDADRQPDYPTDAVFSSHLVQDWPHSEPDSCSDYDRSDLDDVEYDY